MTFVVGLLAALFALLGWWAPIHGSDWVRGLAVDAWLHPLVVAAAALALLLGLTTHALGRLPRRGDALALALVTALLWLGVPGVGATLVDHATSTGVVGLAALAWLLAAYRLGRWAPAMPWLALVAGLAQPAALTVGLVVVAAHLRRRLWMWLGFVVLLGVVPISWLMLPEVPRLRGILLLLELDRFVRKAGEVCVLPVVLALVALARRRAVTLTAETIRTLFGLAAAGVGVELVAAIGPDAGEPVLLASLAPFVVVAVALLVPLAAADPWLRRTLVAGALGVNLVAFGFALTIRWRVHVDFQARQAALTRGVATIPPYRDGPSIWFRGEDLTDVDVRARVAALHHLPEIELAGRVAGFEPAQPYPLRGGLVRHIPEARRQFVRELRLPAVATLYIDGLDWPERRERPVVVARVDGMRVWRFAAIQRLPDKRGVASFTAEMPALGDEAHVVHEGAVVPAKRQGQTLSFEPRSFGYYYLVTCEPESCTLLDAMDVRP